MKKNILAGLILILFMSFLYIALASAATNPKLVAVLEARRWEKDFMLFHGKKFQPGEKSYVELFNETVAVIGSDGDEYQAAFHELVACYAELTKIRKELRKTGRTVETEERKVAVNGTVIGILQMRRYEKNYMLYRHRAENEKGGIKGGIYIDEVRKCEEKSLSEAKSETAKTAVKQYLNLFLKFEKTYEKYDAISDRVRETGRLLEEKIATAGGTDEPIIYILEARRWEKSYMLFYDKKFAPGEKSYVDRFNEEIEKLGDKAGYEYKMYFDALVASRGELQNLLENLRHTGQDLQSKVTGKQKSMEAVLEARRDEKNYLLFREVDDSLKNGIKGGEYLDVLFRALDQVDVSNPETKAAVARYRTLCKEYQANLEDFDKIVINLRNSGRAIEKAVE